MYKNAKPLFLICETPLHVGSGSDLGIVDLPIQRERHTNFPKIEASSLKGALREAFESAFKSKSFTNLSDNDVKIHRVFGFDDGSLTDAQKNQLKTHFGNGDSTQFSGALALTDARLLLFPVKSLYGVFAWITCPRVIKKFVADMKLTDITSLNLDNLLQIGVNQTTSKPDAVQNKQSQLEEFIFKSIEPNPTIDELGQWLANQIFGGGTANNPMAYWCDKIQKDIIVLDDKDFRDFVTLTTEVITRTKINNHTGTVQDGALFSEEYLPAESILYSLAMFSDEFRNDTNKLKSKKQNGADPDGVLEFFESGLTANNNIVQVGANATLGKGIIKTKFVKEVKNA